METETSTSPLRGRVAPACERSGEARSAKPDRVGGNSVGSPPPGSRRSLSLTTSPTSPRGGGEEIVLLARSWIGTPYVHQASLKGAGCDCLGLLRGVWRELHGGEPETAPPYSPDWAEAHAAETLRDALSRHFEEISFAEIAPGDVVLFRMAPRAPAKHCAIVGERDGALTLIHARQNKRVSEEPFTLFWRRRLAFVFRI
jgi:NlpC/P60 family putative phage cell wall peptidase